MDLYTLMQKFEMELILLVQKSQLPLAIVAQTLEKNALQAKIQAREISEINQKVKVGENERNGMVHQEERADSDRQIRATNTPDNEKGRSS